MKFTEVTEQYINLAVQERIKRWQVTAESALKAREAKHRGFVHKDQAVTVDDRLIDDAQRAHKYKATHWLHAAIWAHCYEEVIKKGPSGSDKLWSITQALRGDAGTRKARDQVLREVAKRYRVVDHAFSATVRRKDGTISRIQ